MQIEKERLLALIKDYQNLNDDVDDRWLDMNVYRMKGMTDEAYRNFLQKRKKFTDEKRIWYAEKKKRLAEESEEETKSRRQKLSFVENDLFEAFYEILDSVCKAFGLSHIRQDEFYNDIKQETMLKILVIVNRFDIRRKNPLAYFIQVLKNIAYSERRREFKHRYKFMTHTFLQHHDFAEDPDFVRMGEKKDRDEKPGAMEDFIL